MKLPKIHLRDLFWLTVVVALAAAWIRSHRQYKDHIDDVTRRYLNARSKDLDELDKAQAYLRREVQKVAARERELGISTFPIPEDVARVMNPDQDSAR